MPFGVEPEDYTDKTRSNVDKFKKVFKSRKKYLGKEFVSGDVDKNMRARFEDLQGYIKNPNPEYAAVVLGDILAMADETAKRANQFLVPGKYRVNNPFQHEYLNFNYQQSAAALYNAAIDVSEKLGEKKLAERIYGKAKERLESIRKNAERMKQTSNLESAINSLHKPGREERKALASVLLGLSLIITFVSSINLTGAVIGVTKESVLGFFGIILGIISLFIFLKD